MDREYQKISNIFQFSPDYKEILGISEPFKTLKDLIWGGTEKIDGTNIRIYWDGHTFEFGGHTNKAILPDSISNLLTDLCAKDGALEYQMEEVFGENEVYLYGEGYGYKIQTNGDKYVEGKEVKFILFDVEVKGFLEDGTEVWYDLNRTNVQDVAQKLGLETVSVVFEGTLEEAIEFVKKHPSSVLNGGKHEMEGLVLQPRDVQLYNSKRKLIKCKCKYANMKKCGLVKEEN